MRRPLDPARVREDESALLETATFLAMNRDVGTKVPFLRQVERIARRLDRAYARELASRQEEPDARPHD